MHTRDSVILLRKPLSKERTRATHDLQIHADALRRERERRCADEQRLDHVLLEDVRDRALRRDQTSQPSDSVNERRNVPGER